VEQLPEEPYVMGTGNASEKLVRLAAVGDLLLCRGPEGKAYPRDSALISPALRSLFADRDVLFGNLEFTLPGDGRHVPTEPRVIGDPAFVNWVTDAGFNLLTLANNHTFDALDSGFRQLRSELDRWQLRHFGAGMNLNEAVAATIIEAGGLRLAFVAAVDQRSGPYQFAADGLWGVAPLDLDRLTRQIEGLRRQVQHVIVSLHWGEERFLVPSPLQIAQAHALVEAGASMILGHHPHVLQGVEFYRDAPIVYSLGNFVADDVHFSHDDAIRWNRTERTGCALLADLSESALSNVRLTPTYDAGRLVELDHDGFGSRRVEKASRQIARGVTPARYRREHLWVKTFVPILKHLRWSEFRNLRPSHVKRMIQALMRARHAE
jgi:poly-gamma-glutamate synthesis protein (capsule biosynthesis protein)